MSIRRVAARTTFAVVLAVAGGVVLAGPALALNADQPAVPYDIEKLVSLDGPPMSRGDDFFNWDANWNDPGKPETSNKVDWPVNLIFVSKTGISTPDVKQEVDGDFPVEGSTMHELLWYQEDGEWHIEWDSDNGRKQFKQTCVDGEEGKPYNYHFRLYGPHGNGSLHHPDYGSFVVGTSHIDYREGCESGEHWSGRSESAEAYIAGVFEQHGKWVEKDKIWLDNAMDTEADPDVSDGYATVVHLDEGPPPNDPPIVDAGPDVSGDEGGPIELGGTATDDNGLPAVQWSYTAGGDVDEGAQCSFGDGSAAGTTLRCTDDGTYTVTLSATDGTHSSTDTATVHVANVAPLIRTDTFQESSLGIVAPRPWQVFRAGEPVTLTTNFTDPGSNDTQTCDIAWDDGVTTSDAASDGVCGGVHTYANPGMYTIEPTITDDDGGVAEPTSVMVVAYDPYGGWANADGSFDSPAGAVAGAPDAEGEGWFHLAGKYYPQNDLTRPLGTARSWLPGSDYRFDSAALDWLVVTPDGKVAAKGSGTLAGHDGGYGFVYYAYDGCAAGGTSQACQPGSDRVRLVVWPLSAGSYPTTTTAYDNRRGVGYDVDEAAPTALRSGAVLIQRPG
ncbi:MAG TPA: PKD domain-containing protein [Streptosporangiaceae bacterium]|nr:PKD domain-containing protein [Streptosporangiaceae bacterium]